MEMIMYLKAAMSSTSYRHRRIGDVIAPLNPRPPLRSRAALDIQHIIKHTTMHDRHYAVDIDGASKGNLHLLPFPLLICVAIFAPDLLYCPRQLIDISDEHSSKTVLRMRVISTFSRSECSQQKRNHWSTVAPRVASSIASRESKMVCRSGNISN
jgi:hypothetical protein